MDRVIVTGATGFLGQALVRHLLARGVAVVALGRDPQALARLDAMGAQAVPLDLAKGVPPDSVRCIGAAAGMVHCAALSSAWGPRADFVAANVTGTASAIALARAVGVRRLVGISSPTVLYAHRDQLGLAENAPLPPPVNAYAETKATAERLLRDASDLGPVILRPRGIYGDGDTALLPRLLTAAAQGPLPLLRGGAAQIDLTHVSDVVRAIDLALDAGAWAEGETFHISGGTPIAVTEIVNRACAATGQSVRWRALPWRLMMAAAVLSEMRPPTRPEPRLTRYKVGLFAFRQSLDISKARDMLGWTPQISFDEGLELTIRTQRAA